MTVKNRKIFSGFEGYFEKDKYSGEDLKKCIYDGSLYLIFYFNLVL